MTPTSRAASWLILAGAALAACNPSPGSPPRGARNTTQLSGTLLEQLDGAPYSYLRLQTEAGEAWAAIPVAGPLDRSRPVELVGCIQVRAFDAKAIGRALESVSFCTLPPGR